MEEAERVPLSCKAGFFLAKDGFFLAGQKETSQAKKKSNEDNFHN